MLQQERVDKTMLWDARNVQVWWEYQDGVRPNDGQEGRERLELCWAARDPNKAFIYVKPNMSLTQCIQHVQFAATHCFPLLTCPKWSYMYETYDMIRRDRQVMRNRRRAALPTDNITFHGRTEGSTFHSDRVLLIDNARRVWGERFVEAGMLEKQKYLDNVIKSGWGLQPHGVGLRHAIYEHMALGVPSLIPESTYIDTLIRSCNVVFNELPNDVLHVGTPCYDALSRACIDVWETHMTPRAIVNNVLQQLKSLGYHL